MSAHDQAGARRPAARRPDGSARLEITLDELADQRLAAPRSRTHVLVPVDPVDAGRVRTGKRRFTIGRAADCDLVLDHPTVARRHATISTDADGPLVEAVDGGFVAVNGARTRRARLAVGDRLAIGPFRIAFDGHELVRPAPPAAGLGVAAQGVAMDVGATTILHPTDLRLRPGELTAIIGESGAGKSTLLKALAGVARPTRGQVLVGGEDVSQRLGELGYVPQFDIVHDQLTIAEALGYAARLRLPPDTSAQERDARVAAVVEQLGLSDRLTTRVGVLSGGQRKRAAVGMELLHRPGALFLDEPTTGLDPGLERRLMELFRRLADGGQTVALVTHATASLTLCDRVVAMGRGGHLRFDGPPEDALAHFGVTQFEDVYVALDDAERAPRPPDPARRGERRPLPPLSAPRAQRPVQQPLGYQTRVLASRYATLLVRDRRHVRSALVQVPILALMTAFLFGSGVFDRVADGPPQTAKSATLLFLMVTIAVWLGAIAAAREIVKERSIVARELAAGVQVNAYLASKLIVLMTLLTGQMLAFSAIVLAIRPLHESGGAGLRLTAVLVLASWVAVLCGLAVSASATSEDQATSLIPLLLVPQLLLGGALVPLADMSGAMQGIAALVPARWSFAAAGHAIDLTRRIAADPGFAATSHFGKHFFDVSLFDDVVVGALFAAALFGLLVRRVSPRRTGL